MKKFPIIAYKDCTITYLFWFFANHTINQNKLRFTVHTQKHSVSEETKNSHPNKNILII